MLLQTAAYTPGEIVDVFIAGSGPIGAVFAKRCVDAGLRVLMVEIGAADSFTSKPEVIPYDTPLSASLLPKQVYIPGYHKKNQVGYQKEIDRFTNVIKGSLSTVSIPISNTYSPNLDPGSVTNTERKPFISLARNPAQNPFANLAAEAVTRGVGGMTTHWTCATPELCRDIERPRLSEDDFEDEELWEELYAQAKDIIGTSATQFDKSIRHNLVLRTYQDIYKELEEGVEEKKKHIFTPLPLACHRLPDLDYVEWHAADRILEELFTDPAKRERFTLLTDHRCTRLIFKHYNPGEENTVEYAEVENLLPQTQSPKNPVPTLTIKAKTFVVACGAVATAQVLANSHIPPNSPVCPFLSSDKESSRSDDSNAIIATPLMPNLGKYITEQPMAFCQVVIDSSLMNVMRCPPWDDVDWWREKVRKHTTEHPEDPIPIPFRDPEPQVTIAFTKARPWHVQINRDAFSYGAVAENTDTRVIVDFRFFCYTQPKATNEIVFQKYYRDAYEMPQPTFRFSMSEDDRRRARLMMDDMCTVSLKIGGYLPGSEPKFMTPGSAFHLAGTVRAGLKTSETVADTHSKVHNFNNLYVGGNGVIETGFASNPTLTSICYAIRASNNIIEKLRPIHLDA